MICLIIGDIIQRMTHTFHAHIYFSADETALATKVREDIIEALPQLSYIGPLIPIPIGPHSKPMFEIHIPASIKNYALACIDGLREGLSVLVHPVQQNELEAHTDSAVWLGTKLHLKLEVLK